MIDAPYEILSGARAAQGHQGRRMRRARTIVCIQSCDIQDDQDGVDDREELDKGVLLPQLRVAGGVHNLQLDGLGAHGQL